MKNQSLLLGLYYLMKEEQTNIIKNKDFNCSPKQINKNQSKIEQKESPKNYQNNEYDENKYFPCNISISSIVEHQSFCTDSNEVRLLRILQPYGTNTPLKYSFENKEIMSERKDEKNNVFEEPFTSDRNDLTSKNVLYNFRKKIEREESNACNIFKNKENNIEHNYEFIKPSHFRSRSGINNGVVPKNEHIFASPSIDCQTSRNSSIFT